MTVAAAGFDKHTAVADGRAEIATDLTGFGGTLGGYVAAIALRATSDPVGARPPRSLTTHLLAPIAPGRVDLATRVDRAGASMSSASLRIDQDGATVATALAAFGVAHPSLTHAGLAMPDVPPPRTAGRSSTGRWPRQAPRCWSSTGRPHRRCRSPAATARGPRVDAARRGPTGGRAAGGDARRRRPARALREAGPLRRHAKCRHHPALRGPRRQRPPAHGSSATSAPATRARATRSRTASSGRRTPASSSRRASCAACSTEPRTGARLGRWASRRTAASVRRCAPRWRPHVDEEVVAAEWFRPAKGMEDDGLAAVKWLRRATSGGDHAAIASAAGTSSCSRPRACSPSPPVPSGRPAGGADEADRRLAAERPQPRLQGPQGHVHFATPAARTRRNRARHADDPRRRPAARHRLPDTPLARELLKGAKAASGR